jgi:tetratricopeptide (TPR) repeat protein
VKRGFVLLGVLVLIGLLALSGPVLWSQEDVHQQLKDAAQLEQQSQFDRVIDLVPGLIDSNLLDRDEQVRGLLVLGSAYEETGKFTEARRVYERALSLLNDQQPPSAEYATVLENLANLYQDMRDVTSAIRMESRALAVYEGLQLHAAAARACVNLAALELSDGNRRNGSKYLERAIEEAKGNDGLDEDFFASVSVIEAWLARLSKDTTGEVNRYQRSLELLKRKHGDHHVLTGWTYVLLGAAHLRAGKDNTALEDFQTGLRILASTVGTANPKYIAGEAAYAVALDRTGAHDEAARLRHAAEVARADLDHSQCVGCSISAAAYR